MIEICFDGGCEPNPEGIATYGFVIKRNGNTMNEQGGIVGQGKGMTNNVAEYNALQKALEYAVMSSLVYRGETVCIKGDSKLVIQQLRGEWKIKSQTAKKLCPVCKNLMKQIEERGGHIKLQWIPRNLNERSDELSKEAYNMYLLKNGGKVNL